jgi:hypothetical protein
MKLSPNVYFFLAALVFVASVAVKVYIDRVFLEAHVKQECLK